MVHACADWRHLPPVDQPPRTPQGTTTNHRWSATRSQASPPERAASCERERTSCERERTPVAEWLREGSITGRNPPVHTRPFTPAGSLREDGHEAAA